MSDSRPTEEEIKALAVEAEAGYDFSELTAHREPWHGTRYGYVDHHCRCEACAEANRIHARDRYARLHDPNHPIGVVLRHAMREKGLIQTEVAEALGTQQTVVSGLLHGTRRVSVRYALVLEELLEVDATGLLYIQVDADLAHARKEAAEEAE